MRPGERAKRFIRVIDPATGLGVTGLTIANFTVWGEYVTALDAAVPATWSHDASLVERSGGRYLLLFYAPPVPSWWRIDLAHASYLCDRAGFEGEVEVNDNDSIYSACVKSVLLSAGSAYLGSTYQQFLVANRYNRWDIPFVDADGVPVPLASLYSNFRIGVRSEDQVATVLDASDNSPAGLRISATDAGILTVIWPESLPAGIGNIYAALAKGATGPASLRWESVADLGGDAAKTVPLISSSTLLIGRPEWGVA